MNSSMSSTATDTSCYSYFYNLYYNPRCAHTSHYLIPANMSIDDVNDGKFLLCAAVTCMGCMQYKTSQYKKVICCAS